MRKELAMMCIGAALAVGCGAPSGGGTPDTTPPAVYAFRPSAGAAHVDPETVVEIVFGEPLAIATVNASTFTLRRADQSVVAGSLQVFSGELWFDATRVVFTPAAPLDAGASFTASVTTGIADTSGNRLAAPFAWTFTTAPAGTGAWSPVTTAGAVARAWHRAVWTGSEMIVVGGSAAVPAGFGERYDPLGDVWRPLPADGAPSPRYGHSATWTGSQLIVWGGEDGALQLRALGDGARYEAATERWLPVATDGAPSPRTGHSAVWTGSRLLVWGGRDGGSEWADTLADGASYDPQTDRWTPLAAGGPRIAYHAAVWTGAEMLVFGDGIGGWYDPLADAWSALAGTYPLSPRSGETTVWTGDRLIVWGGYDFMQGDYVASGARYDPATGQWTATASAGAPLPRSGHTAVWTGGGMLVWGGYTGVADALRPRDGSFYDPVGDRWAVTTSLGAPVGREGHTAVWTGTQMIVWGGTTGGAASASGGVFTP